MLFKLFLNRMLYGDRGIAVTFSDPENIEKGKELMIKTYRSFYNDDPLGHKVADALYERKWCGFCAHSG